MFYLNELHEMNWSETFVKVYFFIRFNITLLSSINFRSTLADELSVETWLHLRDD